MRHHGVQHFTIPVGQQSSSDRVILPERDPARVKVTRFHGQPGEILEGVRYPVDETLVLVSGQLKVDLHDGNLPHYLWGGAVLHVPAGENYDVEVLDHCEVVCIFSQAADGTLPEDEPDPQ